MIIPTVSLPHYPARPCRPQGGFGLVMMMMAMMMMTKMLIMRMMTQPALTEAVASLLKRNALPGRASEPVVVARLHLKS